MNYSVLTKKYYTDIYLKTVVPTEAPTNTPTNIIDIPIEEDIWEKINYYRIGLISDTHYNDVEGDGNIPHTEDDADPETDLKNAINYFNENNVDFICCSGDITTNEIPHLTSFINTIKDITEIPLYSCKGNHDNYASYKLNGLWKDYLENLMDKDTEILYFTNSSSDNSSFYFEKNGDIFVFFNLDYGTKSTNGQGIFPNTQYYTWGDIEELQSILDIYRNNRVFIFTHLFFPSKSGNPGNEYTWSGNHDTPYVLTGKQFAILNELNNYYKNAIWFTGHSHYYWYCEEPNDNYRYTSSFNNEYVYNGCDRANVCNYDLLNDNYNYNDSDYLLHSIPLNIDNNDYIESAYNIHLPSLARPLRLKRESGAFYNYQNGGSEGGYMDIYKDKCVLHEITFSKYNPYITEYINVNLIDTVQYLPNGAESWVEDEYLCIKFTDNSQKVGINTIDNKLTSGTVFVYDTKVYSGDVDITNDVISRTNPKVGLYTTGSKYVLAPNFGYNIKYNSTYNGLEIGTSSTYSTDYPNQYPITIKLKGNIVSNSISDINYINEEYKTVEIPLGQDNLKNIESKEYDYFTEYITKFDK